LLDFAVRRRQDETWSWKSTRVTTTYVHRTVSHARLMKQACGSVTLASPLLLPRQLQQ
jgi:hypothetical protein